MKAKKTVIATTIIAAFIFIFFNPIITVVLASLAYACNELTKAQTLSQNIVPGLIILLDITACIAIAVPFLPSYSTYIKYASIALALLLTVCHLTCFNPAKSLFGIGQEANLPNGRICQKRYELALPNI